MREEQGGSDAVDEEAVREFEAAIRENEETMCAHFKPVWVIERRDELTTIPLLANSSAQRERITMIRLALEEKIGVDAENPHYQPATQARRQDHGIERTAHVNGADEAMDVQGGPADAGVPSSRAGDAATGAVRRADQADDGMYL